MHWIGVIGHIVVRLIGINKVYYFRLNKLKQPLIKKLPVSKKLLLCAGGETRTLTSDNIVF